MQFVALTVAATKPMARRHNRRSSTGRTDQKRSTAEVLRNPVFPERSAIKDGTKAVSCVNDIA